MYKNKKIILIAALQSDRGIGKDGDLLYHIKDDRRHFVRQTTGHSVVMGRKNWDSIPERFRPFKNRENIILTRKKSFVAEGALVVHSLEEALEKATSETVYIIGGGEIYSLALPYADLLDLTIISANKPADVFFPEFKHLFELKSEGEILYDEKTALDYRYNTYVPRT